jgi:ferredoxin
MNAARGRYAVRLNPIMCVAHGMCAELFPERITLDDWGYPIVDARPVTGELEAHARRAADACPTLALLVARADVAGGRDRARSSAS